MNLGAALPELFNAPALNGAPQDLVNMARRTPIEVAEFAP
jgi:hypothetical protein